MGPCEDLNQEGCDSVAPVKMRKRFIKDLTTGDE